MSSRPRGGQARGTITITTAQAAVIAQALGDAEHYRRKRAADWCGDCAASPAVACDDHLDDLDQADAYRDLAAELAGTKTVRISLDLVPNSDSVERAVASWDDPLP